MRRIVLRMIANGSLSAFSVAPVGPLPKGPVGSSRAAGASGAGRRPQRLLPASGVPDAADLPEDGRILPRGSLLDLTV